MSEQAELNAMEKARYDASVRALEFELEQFWKRSLFFWGFIAGAFVAFSAADKHLLLQGVIASFGFVCSVVWTLANRGSKFWYENWEIKLIEAETCVTGKHYGEVREKASEKEFLKKWLQRSRYSPSRLTIVLSDYVAVLWLGLLISRFVTILLPWKEWWKHLPAWLTCLFIVLSIVYVSLLGWSCHHNSEEKPTDQPKS
jgi:cell division protein FtsW (lipid II flippase)